MYFIPITNFLNFFNLKKNEKYQRLIANTKNEENSYVPKTNKEYGLYISHRSIFNSSIILKLSDKKIFLKNKKRKILKKK